MWVLHITVNKMMILAYVNFGALRAGTTAAVLLTLGGSHGRRDQTCKTKPTHAQKSFISQAFLLFDKGHKLRFHTTHARAICFPRLMSHCRSIPSVSVDKYAVCKSIATLYRAVPARDSLCMLLLQRPQPWHPQAGRRWHASDLQP